MPTPISFEDWLVLIKGRTRKTASNYQQALSSTLTRIARENGISDRQIDQLTAPFQIERITTEISRVPDFEALNEHGNGMYSAALNRFHDYLVEVESGRTGVQIVDSEFGKRIAKCRNSSVAQRRKRLAKAKRMPASVTVSTTVYKRNPDVVAEVLRRARGKCEDCGEPAPFKRVSDGTPYLEVHHQVQLADGGPDTVENAVALCPNCHRKAHFG